MPKARAPKAPCVLVWLSPQTTVLPGCVRPSSGPMMWTMPRSVVAQVEQLDAELRAVLLQLGDLLRGRFHRDRRAAEHLLGARRRRMIHGGEREVGAAHLQLLLAQHREGLRRRDLVHQVQVDVQHRGRIGRLRDDLVPLPDLLEHRLHARDVSRLAATRGLACMST